MPSAPLRKEEPKVELKPTIRIPKLNSLKEEIANPKKEEEVVLDMNVKNHFTLDQLKEYWNEFALKLKENKRDLEYHIMWNRELTLDKDYTIRTQLDNLVQQDQMNTFNVELMEFLRKKLKNNHILLKTEIAATETKKLIYTSEDKFKYLSQKYPIIDDLKKRLGLETDF